MERACVPERDGLLRVGETREVGVTELASNTKGQPMEALVCTMGSAPETRADLLGVEVGPPRKVIDTKPIDGSGGGTRVYSLEKGQAVELKVDKHYVTWAVYHKV